MGQSLLTNAVLDSDAHCLGDKLHLQVNNTVNSTIKTTSTQAQFSIQDPYFPGTGTCFTDTLLKIPIFQAPVSQTEKNCIYIPSQISSISTLTVFLIRD